MSRRMAKRASKILGRQEGFALITAVMLLFVAMILGLMVVESSDVEIMLSGAHQRYEESLNTAEGGASSEAATVGTGADIGWSGSLRSYVVDNPENKSQILSPINAGTQVFDPGNEMDGGYTVDLDTPPEQWPMDNLVNSDDPADNRFDYHYRVVYLYYTAAGKGSNANEFNSYLYEISALQDTLVEMGGIKEGPK